MQLTDTKSPFSSLTIGGIIVAVLPTIFGLFGFNLDADTASALARTVDLGLTFGGAAVAIYGRIRATKRITANPTV